MKIKNQSPKISSLKSGVSIGLATGAMLVSAVGLVAPTAEAQTNQPPEVPQSFFQSVGGYLTTINTNYSFAANRLEVSVGAGQTGPVLANYVSAQYDLGRWSVDSEVRNAGIAGVIQTAELGGGYAVIEAGDTKLQIGVLAGYDWDKAAVLFEPELVVRKKATKNTYFEAGLSLPEWGKGALNQTPAFFVGTGFTY